ncbi:MAG: TlpA family protein disulfide reductase [Nitrospirae bacterium]|nr:TlpA family protein disulfide reductase [Nitrospirota bacterium]
MVKLRSYITIFILLVLYSITSTPAFGAQGAATDFTLPDINGKKVSLSEFKGKVVILNFWATWCGPCRAEMPSLNKLYIEFKDKGLAVIAVSVDTSENPVKSFIKKHNLSFPVLMDKNKEVSFDEYGVLGLPTTFIIDKNGIIAEKILGEREWDAPDMKGKIIRLLGGKK